MRTSMFLINAFSAVIILATPSGYAEENPVGDIDPQVNSTLQKMVDYFEAADSIAFKAISMTQDVSSSLQKLQFDTSLVGAIQKPNKVFFKKSGNEQASLWFDGTTATILDRKTNRYAKIAITGELKGLVKKLDELGIETPFAGLVDGTIVQHVKDHVYKGDHYGEREIDGVKTTHLALRQDSVDWQLWTDATSGAPRKVVITSKMLAGAPEHMLLIKEVVVNPKSLAASVFEAVLPEGATEVPIQGDDSESLRNQTW